MKELLRNKMRLQEKHAPLRRVMFLHHNYYHFDYLCDALRARGWQAEIWDFEPLDAAHRYLFHSNERLNRYFHTTDFHQYERVCRDAVREAAINFDIVHFSGMGFMAFGTHNFDQNIYRDRIPYDFIELRQKGVKLAYTITGCIDGISQRSFGAWSGGACDQCILQDRSADCSDIKNLSWGHKVTMFSDVVFAEQLPAVDFINTEKTLRGNTTLALSQDVWRKDLDIPDRYKIDKAPNEILIIHGFANAKARATADRDIKGTNVIRRVVDELAAEGLPVRLIFAEDIPSRDMPYIQAQADIAVEQLYLGLNGSMAREAMMTGLPTLGFLIRNRREDERPLAILDEYPIVDITPETLKDELRRFVQSRELRESVGRQSREFMMKWHEAQACAERYETVWDLYHLEGLTPRQIEDRIMRPQSTSEPGIKG